MRRSRRFHDVNADPPRTADASVETKNTIRDDLRAAAALAADGGPGAVVEATLAFGATELWRRLAREEALDAEPLVDALCEVAGFTPEAARSSLYSRAARAPHFMQIEPTLAIDAHLALFLALAPVASISVWVGEVPGDVALLRSAGSMAATRRCRTVALRAIGGDAPQPQAESPRRHVYGLALRRLGLPVGALVVRLRPEFQAEAAALLEELARVLPPVLERELLLRASTSRDELLHAAAERRLVRVGFDLHDGPLQEIAGLGAELARLKKQLAELERSRLQQLVSGRIDDVTARLVEVDRSLRDLSQTLETSSLADRPVPEALCREAENFTRRTGIGVAVETRGSFHGLSASQRIAILRIVQEALSNVREHSIATEVTVDVESSSEGVRLRIADNGQGFDVALTVVAAARRGRLGVVGMNERVRLLGGVFEIDSTVGVGTTITAALPAWLPAAGESDAALDSAS
jgi:signal transduction histidine kinase